MKVLIADDELINKREKEVNEFDVEKAEHLKENFLKDWMMGKIRSSEIEKDMRYFNIKYTNSMGLIVVKPLIKNKKVIGEDLQTDLLSYAIYNIANDIMKKFQYLNVFIDSKKQVVILCDINPIKYWQGAVNELENAINNEKFHELYWDDIVKNNIHNMDVFIKKIESDDSYEIDSISDLEQVQKIVSCKK